ncbi:type II toxin-antitoxin system VapC family toxin [Methanobrevibacter curvatus]|uniref:tRNA(FMet)-specific endonuclease VapC n=1 Tax=Methanobrevibacter curvatus TaxID=49547 RepID=A0A165ZI02_9EURY|nr:PIN domain-containing protein [Methanobrevibacter curvatus]KZX10761.1 tRNA(fMet)-specific endonuclease VapC [Methanobrevibacter curvatus]
MIFLDANFLVSFYIEDENNHKRALKIMESSKNKKKIISKLIIGETINILFTKLNVDKNIIKEIYNSLNNNYTLVDDSYIFDSTIDKIMKSKKRFPFFDYVYITLMEDLKIKEIATFDKHFNNLDNIKRIC